MKKSLLFAVLVVLLVTSCGGNPLVAAPAVPVPPVPPTPEPRNIPPFLPEETPKLLPPKVGIIFLVDRSKSLNGCVKAQLRNEIPYFWFSMFKTLPAAMPEWPKIGVSFFGNETYLPLQSASQSSFNLTDYSSKITYSDKQNQYADYLQGAFDTLTASGAEEKIIVLISDGTMDETKNSEEERAKIRNWFHQDGQKRTDVRVALFHLDCGTPASDLEMWENAEQIGAEFVFRGFDTSNLGVNMQKLAQNTSIANYLPDSGNWWIGQEAEASSFSNSITIPGDTYTYDVHAVTNGVVGGISVDGESALDISQSGAYSKLYKFEEGPAQYCGDRTVTLRTEKSPGFFAYYFIQPNVLSDFFDPAFLAGNAAFFPNVTPLEGSQYIFWNDHTAQISVPDRILESNMAFELMSKYSICYGVWVSAPGEKNEAGLQESKIDIVKRSLQDFMSGAQTLDLKDLTSMGREDIPIWVDVVKFPDDSSKFQTIRRQELNLSHHYYPEYQADKSSLDDVQASINLKYASPGYYDGGELSVYALTRKQKHEVNQSQCTHHPLYGGFDIALPDDDWYAAPSYQNDSYSFADIYQTDDQTDVIRIDFEKLVGKISSMSECGYEKVVFQWNDGTSVDNIRPSVVCDIVSTLSCSVMSPRIVMPK